jgi:5'(3')-deoxyribonucleotidase
MQNILVDVDGVLADLNTEWLTRYNRDYSDTLTPKDLTEWSMVKFVKPECGTRIFSYLDLPDLYDSVLPFENSQEAIQTIRDSGHRVVFVSSGVGGAFAKFKWLDKMGFKPGKWGEDFINAHDKSLIKGLLLIDDRDQNILDYGSLQSILFDAPHNQGLNWPFRAKNWNEVIRILEKQIPDY